MPQAPATYLVYFALGAALLTFIITRNVRSTISVVICPRTRRTRFINLSLPSRVWDMLPQYTAQGYITELCSGVCVRSRK